MRRNTTLRYVSLARLRFVNIPSESLARLVLLASSRFRSLGESYGKIFDRASPYG